MHRTAILWLLFLLALALAALAPLALGQGTYTQIDDPDAVYGTYAHGIDSGGDIVGWYWDASTNYHGFLLSGGTYTTIDFPRATYTELNGINDLGEIVGYALRAGATGFLYDVHTRTFNTVSYPLFGNTTPNAINNAGKIAGYVAYRNSTFGFEASGSKYSPVTPSGFHYSQANGISDSGRIVGVVVTRSGGISFQFDHGKYQRITIPNAPDALVLGINPAGTALVGYYDLSSQNASGFIYQNNTLTTLNFPGAIYTIAYGVNNAGEVVGYFADSSNASHGFLWTPPAKAAAARPEK